MAKEISQQVADIVAEIDPAMAEYLTKSENLDELKRNIRVFGSIDDPELIKTLVTPVIDSLAKVAKEFAAATK